MNVGSVLSFYLLQSSCVSAVLHFHSKRVLQMKRDASKPCMQRPFMRKTRAWHLQKNIFDACSMREVCNPEQEVKYGVVPFQEDVWDSRESPLPHICTHTCPQFGGGRVGGRGWRGLLFCLFFLSFGECEEVTMHLMYVWENFLELQKKPRKQNTHRTHLQCFSMTAMCIRYVYKAVFRVAARSSNDTSIFTRTCAYVCFSVLKWIRWLNNSGCVKCPACSSLPDSFVKSKCLRCFVFCFFFQNLHHCKCDSTTLIITK